MTRLVAPPKSSKIEQQSLYIVAHLSQQHPKNAQKLNSRPVYCSRLYGMYCLSKKYSRFYPQRWSHLKKIEAFIHRMKKLIKFTINLASTQPNHLLSAKFFQYHFSKLGTTRFFIVLPPPNTVANDYKPHRIAIYVFPFHLLRKLILIAIDLQGRLLYFR